MDKNGNAFARIYWYHDSDNIYLCSLSVSPEIRRHGMGTELQKIREEVGIIMGAKTSFLWVKKDTWMYEWYKRRGYEPYYDYDKEDNTIWMKKILVKD